MRPRGHLRGVITMKNYLILLGRECRDRGGGDAQVKAAFMQSVKISIDGCREDRTSERIGNSGGVLTLSFDLEGEADKFCIYAQH